MKMLRTIRFDESDERVFPTAAKAGEWAVPGGFVFANDYSESLVGKRRQAFLSGFLGLESFGHSTFASVTQLGEGERGRLTSTLADHFVACYGAPCAEAARPAAEEEIAFAIEICADYEIGTVLAVTRELRPEGVREGFRRLAAEAPGAVRSLWSLFDQEGRLT